MFTYERMIKESKQSSFQEKLPKLYWQITFFAVKIDHLKTRLFLNSRQFKNLVNRQPWTLTQNSLCSLSKQFHLKSDSTYRFVLDNLFFSDILAEISNNFVIF